MFVFTVPGIFLDKITGQPLKVGGWIIRNKIKWGSILSCTKLQINENLRLSSGLLFLFMTGVLFTQIKHFCTHWASWIGYRNRTPTLTLTSTLTLFPGHHHHHRGGADVIEASVWLLLCVLLVFAVSSSACPLGCQSFAPVLSHAVLIHLFPVYYLTEAHR